MYTAERGTERYARTQAMCSEVCDSEQEFGKRAARHAKVPSTTMRIERRSGYPGCLWTSGLANLVESISSRGTHRASIGERATTDTAGSGQPASHDRLRARPLLRKKNEWLDVPECPLMQRRSIRSWRSAWLLPGTWCLRKAERPSECAAQRSVSGASGAWPDRQQVVWHVPTTRSCVGVPSRDIEASIP
ncbi:hypothetical protein BD413DRAFT_509891 [Trametes elegans]|nr:hypothetical protein BD413DRAFT_509891 [Trametes elegans]